MDDRPGSHRQRGARAYWQVGFGRARTGSVGESLPLLVAAAIADVKEMDLGVREPIENPVWALDERVKSGRIAVMSRARHRGVGQDLSRRSDPSFELIGRASAESLFYRNRY